MRVLALVIVSLVGGCGDDSDGNDNDGSAGEHDLAVGDLSSNPDLANTTTDMACVPVQFPGFAGASLNERYFDCSCGCILDRFEGSFVSGLWQNVGLQQARYVPMQGMGLDVQ